MNKPAKLSYRTKAAVLSAVLLCVIAALVYLWSVYGSRAQSYESTNYAMGAFIQQTVYGKNAQKAAADAASRITALENLISWRVEGSDIQKLNTGAGGDPLAVDKKTFSILKQSLDVAQRSEGAFDPTILPISSLWDFDGETKKVPAAEDIQRLLPYVDYQKLLLDEGTGTAALKEAGMSVDLGAVGKGAACDEAIAAYQEAGADYGILAVGGSVGLYGTKPGGSDWLVAVRAPETGSTELKTMGELSLASGFISTSGTYEKEFEQDGVLYHHLLNPKTGYPENNGLISVTVVCGNGALSDALSTAVFVSGREKGEALLKAYGAEGVFVDTDHHVFVTEGLKNRFRIVLDGYQLEDAA